MNVFFLTTPPEADVAELSEEESYHAVRVLRLKKGDMVILADGKGNSYNALMNHAEVKRCTLTITEKTQHSQSSLLHVAISPTKNSDRLEWFIEKATELGVAHISFISCQRTERTRVNMERCTKTAVSAMKQSKQWWLPEMHELVSFSDFCSTQATVYQYKYMAWCETPHTSLLSDMLSATHGPVLVIIGPEGDFSREEIELAVQCGFSPVSLGKSILRTETAGVYVCALMHSK